ncbi:hypothetical protein BKA82DRAFT_4021681 [Pisolithus tinctorius]|nr:hypothetical protein BKA82DRAFT_4021681 [Pisolithus tinctorius]
MCSPTPPEPPTNTTVTPQSSPSVQTHLDIHMVSPRSERLGPLPKFANSTTAIPHGETWRSVYLPKARLIIPQSEEWLWTHHSKDHPSIPRPRAWRACQIQHLKESSGDLQVFWEVENAGVDTQQTLQEDLVNSFLKELEPMLEVIQTPLDGCMALSLLNCTEKVVLQRLNSPDPTKSGISNTPLHKHLHQATMKQYTVPVVALLAMLIRQEYSGKPFSGSNSKLMELLAVLHIDPEATEEAVPLIHALLFEIWSTAWQHQGNNEIVDPTERCLALLTLREDGAFRNAMKASALAYDTMSLPKSGWTDTKTWQTMLYRGEERWKPSWSKSGNKTSEWAYDKMADDLVNKDDGAIIWNQSSLQAWLKKYAEMQGLLLLQAQMLSGAPSCGTELTAMTYQNTQRQPTHNLMTALTGKDKLIPHALDGITSDILVQDLALVQPFAEIAAKARFPDKPEVVELYCNHVFVNYDCLFDSENVGVYHFYLSVVHQAQHYLGCAVEDIMDMDREDNIEALQAGHSHSTENWVYGISVETLAGAAEDNLPAYLKASMEWQKHCHVLLSAGHLFCANGRDSKGQWQMKWSPDYHPQRRLQTESWESWYLHYMGCCKRSSSQQYNNKDHLHQRARQTRAKEEEGAQTSTTPPVHSTNAGEEKAWSSYPSGQPDISNVKSRPTPTNSDANKV